LKLARLRKGAIIGAGLGFFSLLLTKLGLGIGLDEFGATFLEATDFCRWNCQFIPSRLITPRFARRQLTRCIATI
jgi:hypothetical protein